MQKLLTLMYCIVYPIGLFSRDYISALKGCCPFKIFTRAREIYQGLLAHTQEGRGPPTKKIIVKI